MIAVDSEGSEVDAEQTSPAPRRANGAAERTSLAPRRGRRVRRFDSDSEEEDREDEDEQEDGEGDPDDLQEVIDELGDLQGTGPEEQPEDESGGTGAKRARRPESPIRKIKSRRRRRSGSIAEDVIDLDENQHSSADSEPIEEVNF